MIAILLVQIVPNENFLKQGLPMNQSRITKKHFTTKSVNESKQTGAILTTSSMSQ